LLRVCKVGCKAPFFVLTVRRKLMENRNTKILMIDDDTKLCRLVTDYLAPFGFDVLAAYTGTAGLEKAQNDNFDALILDVMMPEMGRTRQTRHFNQSSSQTSVRFCSRSKAFSLRYFSRIKFAVSAYEPRSINFRRPR
jgi:CheY-like chemotaxis protein